MIELGAVSSAFAAAAGAWRGGGVFNPQRSFGAVMESTSFELCELIARIDPTQAHKEFSKMRCALLAVLAAVLLAGSTGCQMLPGQSGCTDCDTPAYSDGSAGCATGRCGGIPQADGLLPRLHGRHPQEVCGPPGPATGAVTYPYYTTRGPRDYLAADPPSIGR